MSQYKFLRTAVAEERLIEQYEIELYDNNLPERELISMALGRCFAEDNKLQV